MKLFYSFILLTLWAAPAWATTRYVDGNLGANCTGTYSVNARTCTGSDGNAYTTANYATAIAATVAGDILYFRAGTYNLRLNPGTVTFNSGTSSVAFVKVAGYPSETVTLFPSADSSSPILEPITTGQYIWFDNFTVDGTHMTSGTSPISTNGNTIAIVLSYIKVHNARSSQCIGGTAGSGILLGGTGHLVDHVESYDNGAALCGDEDDSGYGIYNSGTNNTIQNSSFHGNGGFGIHVYVSHAGTSNNIIRWNTVYDNGLIATSNTSAIMVNSGSGHKVYGNVAANQTHGDGIQIGTGCNNCEVYNNTVYGNTIGGIVNNTQSNSGSILRNNIVVSNTGVYAGIADLAGTNAFTHSNNLCYNNSSDPANMCDWIGTNPGLTAPVAAPPDMRLSSGSSVAVDAGFTLSSPFDVDIIGTPRPQGPLFDLGAYEFVSASIPIPTVTITAPTSSATYTTAVGINTVILQGTSSISGGAVTWTCDRCTVTSGSATIQ